MGRETYLYVRMREGPQNVQGTTGGEKILFCVCNMMWISPYGALYKAVTEHKGKA